MDKHRGFTLIELMVVVAIIAILAAIVVPSYNEYVRKSRRAEAARFVGEMQLGLEKWRAENPCYGTTPNPPCASLSGTYPAAPTVASSPYYAIAIPVADGATYQITATPRAGSAQAGDRCGVLTLDKNGKPTWANAACN